MSVNMPLWQVEMRQMEAALQDAQSREAAVRRTAAQLQQETDAQARASRQAGAAAHPAQATAAQAAAARAAATEAALGTSRSAETTALRKCKEAEQEAAGLKRQCEDLEQGRAAQQQEAAGLKRRCAELSEGQLQQQRRAEHLEQRLTEATALLRPTRVQPAVPAAPQHASSRAALAGAFQNGDSDEASAQYVLRHAPMQHAGCQTGSRSSPSHGAGMEIGAGSPAAPASQLSSYDSGSGWDQAEAIAEQLRQQQASAAQVQTLHHAARRQLPEKHKTRGSRLA